MTIGIATDSGSNFTLCCVDQVLRCGISAGCIKTLKLGTAARRSLSQNPTETKLREAINDGGRCHGSGTIDLPDRVILTQA